MRVKWRLKCIEGLADSDNVNVICLQGDEVEVREVNEGCIEVEGVFGWCEGVELSFTPKQVAQHFSWLSEK